MKGVDDMTSPGVPQAVSVGESTSRVRQLETQVAQLEVIAYVATHDLRGGADQALYDAEELSDIVEELPQNLVELHDLREIVDNIVAATTQQSTLLDGVDALVGLWRDQPLNLETFDARRFLCEHIDRVDLFVGEAIEVAELGTITGNKGMVWALFYNLIKNALKYNDKSHKEVRIDRTESAIRIHDNGNGIPADKLQSITQPFQRLDTSKEGKGLGLAICQAMTEKHGWTLSVDSVVGKGTTFTITLGERRP